MTKDEIKIAKSELQEWTDRFETIGSDTQGGLSLTAHWLHGGQKLFHALRQVQDYAADYRLAHK